ncbi:hypothetical protein ACJX0J_016079, partial [Zea mays]
ASIMLHLFSFFSTNNQNRAAFMHISNEATYQNGSFLCLHLFSPTQVKKPAILFDDALFGTIKQKEQNKGLYGIGPEHRNKGV